MSFSRTVVIVSGLRERHGNIGTHDTRSKLASHCGKTFQSRISTFQKITNIQSRRKRVGSFDGNKGKRGRNRENMLKQIFSGDIH